MGAEQIEDVALSIEYVKQYAKSHSGLSSKHAYLLRQLVVWQRLSVFLGWNCDNVRASYDEISKSVQDEVFAGAKAFVKENRGRYGCYSLSDAAYGVYSDKGCTKSVATLTTDSDGNTDTAGQDDVDIPQRAKQQSRTVVLRLPV